MWGGSEQLWILSLGAFVAIPLVWIHRAMVPAAKSLHVLRLLVNIATLLSKKFVPIYASPPPPPLPPIMHEGKHLRLGSSLLFRVPIFSSELGYWVWQSPYNCSWAPVLPERDVYVSPLWAVIVIFNIRGWVRPWGGLPSGGSQTFLMKTHRNKYDLYCIPIRVHTRRHTYVHMYNWHEFHETILNMHNILHSLLFYPISFTKCR